MTKHPLVTFVSAGYRHFRGKTLNLKPAFGKDKKEMTTDNIINFPEIADETPDSPALILVKNAIDDLSDNETDNLFYYLLAMGYPLLD